ncbi:MAG: hypothetical protein ACFFAT_03800 [Promethearchaeota archaeon]
MDILEYIFFFIIMGGYNVLFIWKLPTVEEQLKYYYYGIISFNFLWTLGQFFWLLMEQFSLGLAYNIFYGLGNFFSYMAATILMFSVERYVFKKLKYIPTLLLAFFTIFAVAVVQYYGTFMQIVPTIGATALIFIIPIIYYKIAAETESKTRIKAILMGSSLIIFGFGVIFNTYFFQSLIPIMEYVAPIIQLVGAGIFNYTFIFYNISNK